jgi:hypothetical protein
MKDTRARGARWALSVVLAAALAAAGCGSDGGSETADAAGSPTDMRAGPQLEIAGTWTSSFGVETITSSSWSSPMAAATVVEFDNEGNFAVTQNAANDQYAPGKFNKLVWTEPKDDSFYYCTIDFGHDSAEAAKGTTKSADDSDPANSGCGDFGWTELTRK